MCDQYLIVITIKFGFVLIFLDRLCKAKQKLEVARKIYMLYVELKYLTNLLG